MRYRGLSVFLLVHIILCCASAARADTVRLSPFKRVRPMQRRGLDLLLKGFQESPTMRRLIETLERGDVLVYIDVNNHEKTFLGELQFVVGTVAGRYVRVTIDGMQADPIVTAVMAHELQHAVEVAGAPEVVDQSSLRAFYERRGIKHRQQDRFDSIAAREITDIVRAELRQFAQAAKADVGKARAVDGDGLGPVRDSRDLPVWR